MKKSALVVLLFTSLAWADPNKMGLSIGASAIRISTQTGFGAQLASPYLFENKEVLYFAQMTRMNLDYSTLDIGVIGKFFEGDRFRIYNQISVGPVFSDKSNQRWAYRLGVGTEIFIEPQSPFSFLFNIGYSLFTGIYFTSDFNWSVGTKAYLW